MFARLLIAHPEINFLIAILTILVRIAIVVLVIVLLIQGIRYFTRKNKELGQKSSGEDPKE